MSGSVRSETLARLRKLHGPRLKRLRVERAVVGTAFSGVKLSDGRGGMAGSPRKEDGPAPLKHRRLPPPGAIRGLPVLSLLEPWPREPYRAALATAALNALSAPWLDGRRYRAVPDKDALDLIETRPGMSFTLVGAFSAYIERLKAARVRLKVLELRESALSGGHRRFFVPADRAGEVIPGSDAVLITGLAMANGTLEGLLELVRPGAFAAVVGPSGSILPDALFRRGASMAGGCVLTDPDAALDLLSQGACARHLYGACARKLNLFPLGAR